MKLFQAWLLSSLWVSALAAPAVVWKRNGQAGTRQLQSSESIEAKELMSSVLEDVAPSDSSLSSVVFLVKKGNDGSESLTELASNGKLPETSNKYSDATGVYHQVSGIESPAAMVRECSRAKKGHKVLQVSLNEFNRKLTSPASAEVVTDTKSKSAKKRARDIGNSDVFVVLVDPTDDIDGAIARSIDNENIESVVLTAIRSIEEVKHERRLLAQKRHSKMMMNGERVLESKRRRLEEDQGDNNNNNDNGDMSGVYYVYMTPNILSGLLFGFMFTTVTYIGIQCMAAISSQDVYVSKMPSIGREA